MSTQSTYIGVVPRTIVAGGTAIARGTVVTVAAGVAAAAANNVRGDYVALTDIEANQPGQGASLQGGGKVPVLVSVNVAQDDTAYRDASGLCTNVSGGGNVLIGKYTEAGAANGFAEVELKNPL